ncbi:cysteine-rich RLK (RECEPTOR-like protein kinase) 10 [Euphorbia peplus]|nr:cysteine-rich RLK (RECEPTOR-like protein kinase) 10 [Euphorbia peplus]
MEKVSHLALKLFFFIFLIAPFLILSKSINETHIHTECSDNTLINTRFEHNLNILLHNLTSNTPLTGFNNTSVGDSLDIVFGQALCRGDINASQCQTCVEVAAEHLRNSCNSKAGIIWYEHCYVRYSYQQFFLSQVYGGKYVDWETQEPNVSNLIYFDQVLMFLLNNISDQASNNPSMFATGEIKFSDNETIYSLVQCTRGIPAKECDYCVGSAISELRGCCNSRPGGIMVSWDCNVRYELYSFYNSSKNLLIYSSSKGGKSKAWMVTLAICISTLLTVFIGGFSCIIYRCRKTEQEDEKRSQVELLHEVVIPERFSITQEYDMVNSEELPLWDLTITRAATNDFSNSMKIGQGGFGTVYKGILEDGKEIAVKRLSRKSWQGVEELKNEVKLIAKLQHRNLVRLLGCTIEGDEKLLIYEFMPNKSLDSFIFDCKKRSKLHWQTCYNIIVGIARGTVYLHEDSRLKIIHRDLKPSNVLLDHEMVAKISDFGMARNFGVNQNTANTRRVAGTHGYMAPEYAMEGLFSEKSDVFSFGVIILEIISGKKNNGFYFTELARTLLAYAWRLWNQRKELELVDELLWETSSVEEIVRCIHIGLLCVQENPEDRPSMSNILVLFGDETLALPEPKPPAFSGVRIGGIDRHSISDPSVNQMTDSVILPR